MLEPSKEIVYKVTQEYLKSILHYDPDTGIFIWITKPSKKVSIGSIAGCKYTGKGKNYVMIGINKKIYLAHRLAFLYMTGNFPLNEVDHISGDGMDNAWCNLRDATRQENARNCRLRSDNTSEFTGVNWSGSANKWHAQISNNHGRKNLGHFADIKDAIKARKAANVEFEYHENHGASKVKH